MTTASNSRFLLIISLLVILFSFGLPVYAKYDGGTGEPNDPYQIATADDLILLGETPEDYDKHFILTADIDLDPNLPGRKVFDKAVIAPDMDDENLFFQGTFFGGVFDGNDHTISHLTIKGADYIGLFGQLSSLAIISNLGLEEVDFNGIDGPVCGLVGCNFGSITNSYSTGTVSGDGIYSEVGGLVGYNYGSITNSYSTITVSGGLDVSGLVCYNSGSIINSYSTSTVSGDIEVGGLVGHNSGRIINSYSAGTVSGGTYIGGLVGNNKGCIINSYSISNIDGEDDVGGLVGSNEGRIISSFWDMETTGQTTSAGGEGLTTAEMQDINTYLNDGWDFVDESLNGTCDHWQISLDEYPKLRFEGDRPAMPEGLGTVAEPYQIRDAGSLGTVWLEPTAHYRLEASIDLSGITWSTGVIPLFGGSFDGNGHTISHLNIQGRDYLGLFGQLSTRAIVSNLGLEEVDVNGTSDYVGGLVGDNVGSITNSYSIGKVSGVDKVGGLVGFNYGSIINSYSTSSVSGNDYVGGLVGSNYGRITNCYRTGSVTGGHFVGGITGYNVSISYSTNNERYQSGHIINSYSTGIISGDKDVGGLAGNNGGRIISSFWNMQTSGLVDSSGLTIAKMKDINTYLDAGWDFEGESLNGICDYWQISPGEYPRLRLANNRPVMPEGLGTAEEPYLIRSAGDLGTVWSEPTAHYRLEASIDLSDITWPTAVIPWFGGYFEGNGHTIRNLHIQGRSYLGLVGQLNPTAVISNLGLVEVDIYEVDQREESVNIGGLVGYNSGLITNNYLIGTVRGDKDVGGLVGYNKGSIINSYSAGLISGRGEVGGLAGYNGGHITDSYSAGMVSGGFNNSIGGLVGTNVGNTTNSYSTGKVIGHFSVGGLIGINGGSITDSYSNSKVRGDNSVGGLVGVNYGGVTNSYSTGRVESTGSFGEDSPVGGLVGKNRGSLVGMNREGSIISSFWDMETSEQTTSAGGEGLNTTKMKDITTYLNAGWDFVDESLNGTFDEWQISPGEYPELCIADNRPVMPEGSGTTAEPYLIRNAEDMKTVWYEPTAHYRLEASIDLSGITWSTAVIPWFGGYFDGNGHTISHLHIQGVNYVGLFRKLDYEAVICNLGLEEVDVNGTDFYAGSFVGVNDGTITNCYSIGNVHGYGYVGGLVSSNNGIITNSYSTGSVSGDAYVGGLVGFNNQANLCNCYSTCIVSGSRAGGLVGESWGGNIINCYSTGKVNGGGLVGGLVGENDLGVIESSFWDVETSGLTRDGSRWSLYKAFGLTTAEMQTSGTFLEAGWDFVGETANGTEDIWWINEGQDYPRLWWELGDKTSP